MRLRCTITAVAALLTACSAPADVLVTRSDGSVQPVETLAVVPTTVVDAPVATTPGERPATSEWPPNISDLLLDQRDVPGWAHSGPMAVWAEPTYHADDCAPVNTAWQTASTGVRTRGGTDGVGFRNTVAEYDNAGAAAAVIVAVELVPTVCPSFTELPDVEWWSEPYPLRTANGRSAAIVLGNQSVAGWAIGFWQVEQYVVVLEVDGEQMWQHLDALFATMTARVDGSPAALPPLPALEESTNTAPTNSMPADVTPASTTPTPVTIEPELSDPLQPDDAFPPEHADWADHTLARLAPHPSEFGDGWAYSYGSTNEAEPADPTKMIEGCDFAEPGTLPGISLSYDDVTGGGFETIEIEIGQGNTAELTALLDMFRAFATCDLAVVGIGPLSLVDGVEVGSDDSVALTGEVGMGNGAAATIVLAAARYDDLVVFFLRSTATDVTAADAVAESVAIMQLIASKR